MLVAGGVVSMSGVGGGGVRCHVWCREAGPMSQCIVGNGHMGTLSPTPPPLAE